MRMIKISLISVIIILFVSISSLRCETNDNVSYLPASLKVVDEYAFSETALEYVVFPEGFLCLNNNAFENTFIKGIYIPQTTRFISENAFGYNTDFTMYGIEDTYADEWAKKHNIPFKICDMMFEINRNIVFKLCKSLKRTHKSLFLDEQKVISCSFSPHSWLIRDMKPKKRSELHSIEERFP